MEAKMAMGARLKAERTRLKMSQTDFGRECGVTQNTQYLYEQGERMADGEYFAKAADIGVDVSYVLVGASRLNTKISARELALVDRFRLSEPAVQAGVLSLLESTAKLQSDGVSTVKNITQTAKGDSTIQIGSADNSSVKVKTRK